MLVIEGAVSSLSVVSQPVQPGGSSTQSAGVCSYQHRVNTAETRAATVTVTAGG